MAIVNINIRTAALLFVVTGFVNTQKPWDPTPRTEGWWLERHERFVNNTRDNGHNINIVFMGSSSIENWGSTGSDIWNAKYAPLGAVNYGIGGDRIEHQLWRILDGELEGLRPRLVVVYVGSNNIPMSNHSVWDIVSGTIHLMSTIWSLLPGSNILFVANFPRSDVQPVNATFTKITEVNQGIASALDDGTANRVFDMFWDLAESWGNLKPELYQSDNLHLSRAGYVVWDDRMNETFYSLLN